MKTLGVIKRIGPESTIEYYRHLIAAYRKRKPDGSSYRVWRNPPASADSNGEHR